MDPFHTGEPHLSDALYTLVVERKVQTTSRNMTGKPHCTPPTRLMRSIAEAPHFAKRKPR